MTEQPKKRGPKPVKELTPKQRRALQEIRDFVLEHGFPPSSQELGETLGITAASAYEQVSHLIRKGYVTRDGRKARSLRLVREVEERAPTDLVSIPVLGTVAAGQPLLAEENILDHLLIDRHVVDKGRCFALRINGQSMQGAQIDDGNLVVVRKQPVAQSGDIVVALFNGESTVKRLSIRDHELELRPENPEFQPIVIGPDDDLVILGKVIAVRRL